ELWRADGTDAGTTMVKDIYPGYYNNDPGQPYDSDPSQITDVGGTAFFVATDPVAGYELWRSDGTEAGTALVKDINPGDSGTHIRYLTEFAGKAFFQADDAPYHSEMWSSDGTDAGTMPVENINSGPYGSQASD